MAGIVNAVACGDTLTSSYTMTSDLTGCTINGLNIGANNIILDCNGHKLTGIYGGSGIYLNWWVSGNVIKNCVITNFNNGILIDHSSNNNLTGNVITSNGNGVYIYNAYSTGNNLTNNSINSNTQMGVLINFSTGNTLTNNYINSNVLHGIDLEFTSGNTITSNTVNSNTGYDLYLTSSTSNTVTNNVFDNTNANVYIEGPAHYGCTGGHICEYSPCSDDITHCNNPSMCPGCTWSPISYPAGNDVFSGNTLSGGTYGFDVKEITNNLFVTNTITGSSYGIRLSQASSNIIYNNYFSNSVNAVDSTGTNSWNIAKTLGTNIVGGPYLGGNYWSDYTGSDTDSDGLGNTLLPYKSGGNIATGGDNNPLMLPDTTPPVTTASAKNSDLTPYTFGSWTTSSYVTVTLTCNDNPGGSGCMITKYCTDSTNTCNPVTSGTTYSGKFDITTQGISHIRYYSIDNAGNTEVVKSQTIKIDSIPPVTTASAVNSDGTSYDFGSITTSSYVNVTIICNDNPGGSGCSTTKYCTDTGTPCTPSTTYTTPVQISTAGISHIRYYSIDNAGNTEVVKSQTIDIEIDSIPPVTTASAVNSDGTSYDFGSWTTSSYVTVTLTCNDNPGGSGCMITKYCTGAAPCTPSSTYPGAVQISTGGTSYISYYSIDNAGNSEVVKSQTIKIQFVKNIEYQTQGSEIFLRYTPAGKEDCTTILFIQVFSVHLLTTENQKIPMKPSMGSRKFKFLDDNAISKNGMYYVVDGAPSPDRKGYYNPYYAMDDSLNPLNPNTKPGESLPGHPFVAATMADAPSVNDWTFNSLNASKANGKLKSINLEFETCAVCAQGKQLGQYYACVLWTWTKSGPGKQASNIVSATPEPSSNFLDAVKKWKTKP